MPGVYVVDDENDRHLSSFENFAFAQSTKQAQGGRA